MTIFLKRFEEEYLSTNESYLSNREEDKNFGILFMGS
jgi:hypothetical protein